MSTVKYWVWLSCLPGLPSRTLPSLLEHFGDPMEVYFAAGGEYARVAGLRERDAAILAGKSLDRADNILQICREKDIRIMTMQDADYPRRLTHIYDPPAVLYVRGRLPVLDEEAAIAVVGTRRVSPYGVKMGLRMGYEITKGGGLIISGLAAGVDTAAAKGALNAGGACVGVLGSAIDVYYPRANERLIEDVVTLGALISEYPPGYPTRPENFPRRNRILSGLSVGVTVIEAPTRSGALITADLALEQGKELFVVPGNVDSPNCEGSNALLRDCAKAVSGGWDVLCEFESLFPHRIRPQEGRTAHLPPERQEHLMRVADAEMPTEEEAPAQDVTKKGIDTENTRAYIVVEDLIADLSEEQRRIVSAMTEPELHIDEIIVRTGLPAATVLPALTMLTIQGHVTPGAGMRFTLNIVK